jgi:hypothetical protein
MAKTFMDGIGAFCRSGTGLPVTLADTIIKQVSYKEYHIQTAQLGLGIWQIWMVGLHMILT